MLSANAFEGLVSRLAGIELISDLNAPAPREWVQVRFPRSKRKRIRKKWRKNPRYWGWVPLAPEFFRMNDPSPFPGVGFGNSGRQIIVAHPEAIEMLKEAVTRDDQRNKNDGEAGGRRLGDDEA